VVKYKEDARHGGHAEILIDEECVYIDHIEA
jgi:hypothetical protein